jgi:hypothetical protein
MWFGADLSSLNYCNYWKKRSLISTNETGARRRQPDCVRHDAFFPRRRAGGSADFPGSVRQSDLGRPALNRLFRAIKRDEGFTHRVAK